MSGFLYFVIPTEAVGRAEGSLNASTVDEAGFF